MSSELKIESADGNMLTAYCYEPTKPVKAGVIITPAMAVKQSFYATFAAHLALQGFRVWTFDYYGIGESQHGSKRSCNADVTSWINADYENVVQHASATMAGLPLYVLGHSLGGLLTPMLPSINKISGVVNISVGSGAKRHMSPRLQRSTPLLWHVVSPLLCSIFGYFPGARIGIMGDIPRNAMSQWRGWCLNSDYLLAAEPGASDAYAAVSYPMLSLFFSDDELLTESGARWIHNAYSNAKMDYRVVNAADIDAPRIGHFGFFKSRQQAHLWPAVIDWLDEQVATAS